VQFIDETTITVGGGNGGNGIVAWRREKYVPKGGPAGGDGGRGGDVVFVADTRLTTLVEFRYTQNFIATSGENGGTSNCTGRSGTDLIVHVPAGTLVYVIEDDGDERLLADLADEGQRLVVAKGGRGGLGNQHFATSRRQAPHFAEQGEPGQRRHLRLELKLLADCGLIGLPNAGKSSLLAASSAARPRIADYPFTTLEPQLGVVRLDPETAFVMVDLPGLIAGASEGVGLGDRFLRHAERARTLIHLLDGALSIEEILANKASIDHELAAWSPSLAAKPTLLALSKCDLPNAQEHYEALRKTFPTLHRLSSATHEGLRELLFAAWQQIDALPPPAPLLPDARTIQLRPREPFHITREGEVFLIQGERVERLASMTDFANNEALGRFERILDKLGVDRALRDLGIQEGDTVRIGGFEFTFS